MKVYVASRYSRKAEAQLFADELVDIDIGVTATWFEEPYEASSQLADVADSQLLAFAMRDIDEIRKSDMLVVLSDDPTFKMVRGGMQWETGFAYALGKPVLVVGPVQHIFLMLPDVAVVSDKEEAKKWLLERKFRAEKMTLGSSGLTFSPSNPCGNSAVYTLSGR